MWVRVAYSVYSYSPPLGITFDMIRPHSTTGSIDHIICGIGDMHLSLLSCVTLYYCATAYRRATKMEPSGIVLIVEG